MSGKRWLKRLLILLGLAALTAWLIWPYFAGTKGADRLEKQRDAAFLRPDPAPFQEFLNEVRDKSGLVDYVRAQASPKALLEFYLSQVALATPAAFGTDQQRLAFYLNAYNALVIAKVMRSWPIDSVADVGPLHRFFRQREHRVAGNLVSLHGFEQKVIRNYDPRLHFALNCASLSCPILHGEVFRADTLEQQLEQVSRHFINDPQRNRYDAENKVWYLSKIFSWYAEDFGGEPGVRALLKRYAKVKPAANARLEYLPYDWRLNGL